MSRVNIEETKNILSGNSKLSLEDKEKIEYTIKMFSEFFKKLGVELTTPSDVLSSISIERIPDYDTREKDKAYFYKREENKIYDNSKCIKDDNKKVFDFCYSILSAVAENGVVYSENNTKYGTELNNMILSDVVKNATDIVREEPSMIDNKCDNSESFITLKDTVFHDLYKKIDVSMILTYFVNSEGEVFFNEVSRCFDSYDSAKSYLKSIDDYEKEPISSRKKYDELMEKMYSLENNDVTSIKM